MVPKCCPDVYMVSQTCQWPTEGQNLPKNAVLPTPMTEVRSSTEIQLPIPKVTSDILENYQTTLGMTAHWIYTLEVLGMI